ncbi:hypothetical protein G6F65_017947 [Rhizopus arrhizus]|nr:hypothetical protein G6F65_017947 [Rhizopus arrhizus]
MMECLKEMGSYQQIAALQQELSDILALKASVRWQVSGETSVKYLSNLYRQRTVEHHTNTLRPNESSDPVKGIEQLLPIAQQFYQTLYTADPVDDHQVDLYLDSIRDAPHLNDDHTDLLWNRSLLKKLSKEQHE